MLKSLSLTWLSKADLSNLNAGEGAGNVTELKLYDESTKPYASGQAVRRALFDTIQREYEEHFHCTPESPCTDVEKCWSCDLRGFLAPEEGAGGTRRWSPVKVSPAFGQLRREIVSDLLTRHSDLAKENRESKDMRLAHVQMMDNIYRLSVIIDILNIGKVREPKIEKKQKKEQVVGWVDKVNISKNERVKRTKALLDAIYHLSGFAKQARSAASLAPEILVVAAKPTYNQRGQQVIDLNEQGAVPIDRLETVLKEYEVTGDKLCVGWTPGIIQNEGAVQEIFGEFKIPVVTVAEAIQWAKEQVEKGA
mgnify:CR=1 FL=1